MALRGLIVLKPQNALGTAAAHKLFEALNLEIPVEPLIFTDEH